MNWQPGTKLDVFLGEERLGEIERRGPARYRFAYDPSAVDEHGAGGIVLSVLLPVQSETFPPARTTPFFEGLLPEGAVRAASPIRCTSARKTASGCWAPLGPTAPGPSRCSAPGPSRRALAGVA